MSYTITIVRSAQKEIKKLPPHIRGRIKLKLEWSASQPDPLKSAEPLTKPFDAQYRFRVGVYRILFDVEGENIVVLHVQHRREVYRR